MSKSVTLCFFFLVICAPHGDSFKIIGKIKNYLLPTTTTTTAVPIVPDYEQNGTHQEVPWGEEATEENVITTTARLPANHDDEKSFQPKPTPTSSIQDNEYMPTKNRTLFPPPKGQPVYPGMPTTATISDDRENCVLPGETNPCDDVRQQATTPKSVDNSHNQPQDYRPVQNSSQGISDNGLGESKSTGNQHNVGQPESSIDNLLDAQHGDDGTDVVDLFASLTSNGTDTTTEISGNSGSGPVSGRPGNQRPQDGNLNGNTQQEHGNENYQTTGKDLVNANEKPKVNGNQNETGENAKGSSQQTGGNSGANENQNSQQSFGNGNNQDAYGKPALSGSSHQNNENEIGNSNQNINKTQHVGSTDDTFIFPDDPSLNPSPEPEVGGSRIGSVPRTTPKPGTPSVVPVDGGRRVIDAPVKDCGKGRKLTSDGECKKVARK